jgi:N-acetylmuramidase/Putative peptidoglycan binding domain
MFKLETALAIAPIAKEINVPLARLLGIAEVESAGIAYAKVNGREEPLIRIEGHYFDKRLEGEAQKMARKLGLASPIAGRVKNPSSQEKRYAMLAEMRKINAQAADESCSWGVGQVMGAHWKWLGYSSVNHFVATAEMSVIGQVELMAKFISKSGISGKIRAGDWKGTAGSYNGPGYRANKYDTKMEAASARYEKLLGGKVENSDGVSNTVKEIQMRLTVHGFPMAIDGVRTKATDNAIKAFQRSKRLAADGVVGTLTWNALRSPPARVLVSGLSDKADVPAASHAKAEPAPVSNSGKSNAPKFGAGITAAVLSAGLWFQCSLPQWFIDWAGYAAKCVQP